MQKIIPHKQLYNVFENFQSYSQDLIKLIFFKYAYINVCVCASKIFFFKTDLAIAPLLDFLPQLQ